MNNQIKNTILVLSISLLGGLFFANQAQANGLSLDVIEKCNFQYGGDSCIAELKLTNNAGEILDGEASLSIDYQGICGDGSFDGEGIEAQFSVIDNNWLNFSGWENGTTAVSGFEIAKGETQPKLKIETVPNLCPGEYTFNLELKGTTKEGGEVVAPPVVLAVISGGGGGYYYTPTPTPTLTSTPTPTPTLTPSPTPTVAGAATERKGKIGGGLAQGGTVGGVSTEGETLSPSPTPGGLEGQAGQGSLFATIGSIITLGTGNKWVGGLAVLVLIVVVYYLVKAIFRRPKKGEPA